jgi:hypothetical protein
VEVHCLAKEEAVMMVEELAIEVLRVAVAKGVVALIYGQR